MIRSQTTQIYLLCGDPRGPGVPMVTTDGNN